MSLETHDPFTRGTYVPAMTWFFADVLHNGSLWLLAACTLVIAGVIVALFTEAGSGIASHPYSDPHDGGELASDLPPESIGRAEFDSILRKR
jgi:hypothetical protein